MDDNNEDLNICMVVGRVGSNPVLRCTDEGDSFIEFSLYSKELVFDNDKQVLIEQRHTILAWGEEADMVAALVPLGQRLFIEGRLNYGRCGNADGAQNPTAKIVMQKFSFLKPDS